MPRMPRLSLLQQAKKEEYEKSQKADTIYRIMTNKLKSSNSSNEENRLNNLSIEDCELICQKTTMGSFSYEPIYIYPCIIAHLLLKLIYFLLFNICQTYTTKCLALLNNISCINL